MTTVGVTTLVTANVIALLVALGEETQPELLFIAQVITSAFMGEVNA